MKRSIPYLSLIILICITISSCKKNTPEVKERASFLIGNFIVGGVAVKSNLSAPLTSLSVGNNLTNSNFNVFQGSNHFYIYAINDSLHPYFNRNVNVRAGDIYSLFLSGQAPLVDTIFIKEEIALRSDSSFGVRVINLSPNSPALKVTLASSPSVSEFNDVNYKQVTSFRSFPAKFSSPQTYMFQIRNALTNTLISSISLTGTNTATGIPRFQNISLVVRGITGGSPAVGISRVNHF